MSKNKYYAVAQGRKTGIFTDWFGTYGAEEQVRGYSGAKFKGFGSYEEAEDWLQSNSGPNTSIPKVPQPSQQREVVDDEDSKITIYTDGGCIGNPGPGGYGVVILSNGQRTELSGGFRLTTNNRMELIACIVGLQALKDKGSVVLYSDSQYVVNGITLGWAEKWRQNNWKRNKKESAENPDLWDQLLDICSARKVDFKWIRGHVGTKENERCDQLSMRAAQQRNLPIDTYYENLKSK